MAERGIKNPYDRLDRFIEKRHSKFLNSLGFAQRNDMPYAWTHEDGVNIFYGINSSGVYPFNAEVYNTNSSNGNSRRRFALPKEIKNFEEHVKSEIAVLENKPTRYRVISGPNGPIVIGLM